MLLAAVHQWLGSPLGAQWGAELWALVKSGVVIVPAYWGLAVRVRSHNARTEALYAAHRAHLDTLRVTQDTPAGRLTDGRRLGSGTGSHAALHSAASSTARPFVVVEHEPSEED